MKLLVTLGSSLGPGEEKEFNSLEELLSFVKESRYPCVLLYWPDHGEYGECWEIMIDDEW